MKKSEGHLQSVSPWTRLGLNIPTDIATAHGIAPTIGLLDTGSTISASPTSGPSAVNVRLKVVLNAVIALPAIRTSAAVESDIINPEICSSPQYSELDR